MTTATQPIKSLEDLRQYVREVLCHRDQLDAGAFRITEQVLVRRNRPCGVQFCLHGPRAVTFFAIWDALQNIILFYSSSGERFCTVRLLDAPALAMAETA